MKVVFIQPGQFLRTSRKTNPFFDPIIDVCQKNGIEWSIWLPKGSESGYPREHVCFYHVISICDCWFWRFMHVFFPWLSVARVHYLFGCFARPFCRAWREADFVITNAFAFANELVGIRGNRRIADVQHGVIYSRHLGYFSQSGVLRLELQKYANYSFWFYGPGYANCFFKNPENHRWLDGRVKVVGDVVRAGKDAVPADAVANTPAKRHLIVLANQMTPDDDAENGLALKRVYERWLDEMTDVVAAHPNVKVVLRNHPRFGNVVDLSDWKLKYPWLGADQRPFDEVFPESICCVTINSTTVFDAIPYGCPSVLIDGHDAGWRNIMVDEYDYPCGQLTVRELLSQSPNEQENMRQRLKKWYNTHYTPFDAERALRLIKGEI